MGIRVEKDTILNWINEMGKFLRLVVEKWESGLSSPEEHAEIGAGYTDFFGKERGYFQSLDLVALKTYTDETLQVEQVRPLALLMMYDGFLTNDRSLLEKAKGLLEHHAAKTGSFSFEDFDHLAKLDAKLKQG
ncbi:MULTISPECIES: hypothetical protein [Sphingobacterium]|uniref:Uncharacterized protein n=1 Tax=Sphingobacterium populi TaxID=1812824 RepID=A0ABW5UC66_9SPHI|nr:hypothetical protein [Sphingobacterium sp. CFCC 11742]